MTAQPNAAAPAGSIKLADLTVHRLGFGAMRICSGYTWGMPKDRPGALQVLKQVVALGINFIDTADSYGPEVSETLIAEALHPYPAGIVIATKGGYTRPNEGSWVANGHPDHLRKALEGSLKRLRLNCIDVYQLHTPDPRVPFTDSVGALAALQRAGKIRHIGLSNVSVQQLNEARRIAPIVSVQNHYNYEDQSDESVLAACERLGIAYIPWYPLGAGQSLKSAKLKKIALQHGATSVQVALAWLLARSPVMLPIPGTGKLAHLEENVGAAGLRLSAEQMQTLR
ncbi:MAG: oxidoreductase [Betaproteobacteria bacterium]|nr:oxidoreductase [Betaproteobacteria bacterium]